MIGMNTQDDADYANRKPRWWPTRADPVSDALDAFFLEHRLCGVLESAVDDEAKTISLTCCHCDTSLVSPLA
jgi:hypothetical protein